MILHCTPPYWYKMPNAALGYLKGFLEARGISVTNVYWNVVLSKRILRFCKDMGDKSGVMESFPSEFIIFYIGRHLLTGDHSSQTTADQVFSSIYTKEEINEVVHGIRDDIDRYIKSHNLDKVELSGFTVKTYQWLMGSYIMSRLKEMNPDMSIVMGGIYNEDQAHAFMRVFPQCDFAVWGEGEYPLYSLVKAVNTKDISQVPHLVYRQGKNIVSTKAPDECLSSDEYPFADHTDYFTIMKKVDPFNKSLKLPIWGTRACNWNKCKFCALNEGYTYRARSPHNIVEEMEYQSEKYKIDEFFFTDSDIAGNKKRFMTLLTLLIESIRKRKRPYRIVTEISPQYIDQETVVPMKRAGFYEVQAGFEAISESLLEKMQKRQKLVHNLQAMKIARQKNLHITNINIIRGIPTETAEDIKETCTNMRLLRFIASNLRPTPTYFFLIDKSPFYNGMSDIDREKWNESLYWEEIAPSNMIADEDRFRFFMFYQDTLNHYQLWNNFENLLRFYADVEYSYTWVKTPEGSLVEEKGLRTIEYKLDQNETNILVFCDTIRSLSELEKEFPHLREDELTRVLTRFQDAAFLYMDRDGNCISILDATQIN
jgi:radical SAM superfamily enzyme YgiQ (UPF0313 family)